MKYILLVCVWQREADYSLYKGRNKHVNKTAEKDNKALKTMRDDSATAAFKIGT